MPIFAIGVGQYTLAVRGCAVTSQCVFCGCADVEGQADALSRSPAVTSLVLSVPRWVYLDIGFVVLCWLVPFQNAHLFFSSDDGFYASPFYTNSRACWSRSLCLGGSHRRAASCFSLVRRPMFMFVALGFEWFTASRVTHPKPTCHQRIALRYIGHCRRQHPSLASPRPTCLG